MKAEFNKNWNKSKQPRKQRKFLANAPNHIKRKQLTATLDKPLRTKHDRRSIEVRKNDEVKVMRGKFAKKQGKILIINTDKAKVQIDGLTITKRDGEKVGAWFHASNLKIVKLEDSDVKRMKTVKAAPKEKKQEKTPSKPAAPTKAKAKKIETKTEDKKEK
ncbi:MAG: large subunit ribosomal protein L24 [Patescibacteria group bacterium]|jgi:large subunit ribosomal protein L24